MARQTFSQLAQNAPASARPQTVHRPSGKDASLVLQRAHAAPSTLTAADVLTLQRTIGNRATVGLLQRQLGIQPKLRLGPADDAYEQEADQVARQVVQRIQRPPVQRDEEEGEVQRQTLPTPLSQISPAPTPRTTRTFVRPPLQRETGDEEELAQMKPLSTPAPAKPKVTFVKPTAQRVEDEDELAQMKPLSTPAPAKPKITFVKPTVQRTEDEDELAQRNPMHGPEGGNVDSSVESQIAQARGGGRSLDAGVRRSMESAFGADFGGVRVHTGAQADTLNRSLNARAFTTGSDIFFRRGEYNPGSSGGQQLLAHELTHTVQQGAAGVQRHEEEEIQAKPVHDSLQRQAGSHTPGCSCLQCSELQRKPAPEIQRHDNEEEILTKRVAVTAVVQRHSADCNCASCKPVQRKTFALIQRHHAEEDLQAKRLQNSAGAIQRSHDTGCNCAACRPIQRQEFSLHPPTVQRHHQEEDVQTQRTVSSVQRAPVTVHQTTGGQATIQRHSGYEHYMLGQIPPDQLSAIPMVREIPALKKQYESLRQQLSHSQLYGTSIDGSAMPKFIEIYKKIQAAENKLDEVKHTIQQEMQRLLQWKDDPEALEGRRGEKGKVKQEVNGQWQVPIVVVPVKGDGPGAQAGDSSIVVSYSEINTLPDFFGNPESLANTPKSKVLSIIQGVRQQSHAKLAEFYQEIFGENIDTLSRKIGMHRDFEGATGDRGRKNIPEKIGPLPLRTVVLESQLNSATERESEEEQSEKYFGALERNACHFAPYSWDQWQSYHERALKLAEDAYNEHMNEQLAKMVGLQDVARQHQERAADLANQALLLNAFGEHYLQDSFAAGHLIDKTYIMQAFMRYLDKNKHTLGSTATAKARWEMAGLVADNSHLRANPQALDDAMMRGELDEIEDSADMIGMGVKPEIELMMWWRNRAFHNKKMKHVTPTSIANDSSVAPAKARNNVDYSEKLLNQLVANRLVDKKTVGRFHKKRVVYSLRQIHIDALKRNKKGKGQGAYQPTTAFKMMDNNSQRDFKKEAAEFNLAAYNAFMGNAYVGGATKFFHDKFCREGLEVITGEGVNIGTIYGDRNMMNAGGQKGVEYSAQTAQWSRESIFKVIQGGKNAEDHTTADIRKRFPIKVKLPAPDNNFLDLAMWNRTRLASDKMMEAAAGFGAKVAYKKKKGGGISEGAAIDVARIASHDNDIF